MSAMCVLLSMKNCLLVCIYAWSVLVQNAKREKQWQLERVFAEEELHFEYDHFHQGLWLSWAWGQDRILKRQYFAAWARLSTAMVHKVCWRALGRNQPLKHMCFRGWSKLVTLSRTRKHSIGRAIARWHVRPKPDLPVCLHAWLRLADRARHQKLVQVERDVAEQELHFEYRTFHRGLWLAWAWSQARILKQASFRGWSQCTRASTQWELGQHYHRFSENMWLFWAWGKARSLRWLCFALWLELARSGAIRADCTN